MHGCKVHSHIVFMAYNIPQQSRLPTEHCFQNTLAAAYTLRLCGLVYLFMHAEYSALWFVN